jgi:parvulin-like peptidyl-prolyl isomerase
MAAYGQGAVSGPRTLFNSISKEEIEILLADVANNNPKALERMANDPETRRLQIANLKELLAFASQAERDGLAAEPTNRQELENIGDEVLAVNYDRELNKDKGPLPPFANVTDAQVAQYWADKGGQRTHESEFQDFLNAKVAILKANNPSNETEVTPDQIAQARDLFAKIRIYKAEYDHAVKTGRLTRSFVTGANLQVKLQQAQFLARLYADRSADNTRATDNEISTYISKHPEFDQAAKRTKAEQILARARAGEDFAALANEHSDDPGNKGPDGTLQGGLYKDVAQGRMIPAFEQAALALEPGQVAPQVVETEFGYHIIKLENKRVAKDDAGNDTQLYDVRHILVSTTYPDPDDPSREMPVRDYVRTVIEKDKENRLVQKLIADNNIRVAEDFTVPAAGSGEPPTTTKQAPVKKKRVARKGRH